MPSLRSCIVILVMVKNYPKNWIFQRNFAPTAGAALSMKAAVMFAEVAAIPNAKIADINFEKVKYFAFSK